MLAAAFAPGNQLFSNETPDSMSKERQLQTQRGMSKASLFVSVILATALAGSAYADPESGNQEQRPVDTVYGIENFYEKVELQRYADDPSHPYESPESPNRQRFFRVNYQMEDENPTSENAIIRARAAAMVRAADTAWAAGGDIVLKIVTSSSSSETRETPKATQPPKAAKAAPRANNESNRTVKRRSSGKRVRGNTLDGPANDRFNLKFTAKAFAVALIAASPFIAQEYSTPKGQPTVIRNTLNVIDNIGRPKAEKATDKRKTSKSPFSTKLNRLSKTTKGKQTKAPSASTVQSRTAAKVKSLKRMTRSKSPVKGRK